MEGSREYRDYRIDFSCRRATERAGPYVGAKAPSTVIYICEYSIWKNIERKFSFRFMGTLEWFRSLDESEFNRFRNHGFDIACGLIDTEKYKEYEGYKSEIVNELPKFNASEWQMPTERSEISNEKIRHEILEALRKIRKENEKTFETADFNEDGFCKVLRITKADLAYNFGCLKEEGLIEIENGRKYITIKGIKKLEQKIN